MSRTSIPVSEAAVLTLLLEQPDMPELSYNELAGSLTSPRAIQIAKEIRQQGGRATKTSAASRTGTKVLARAKKAPAAVKQAAAKKSATSAKKAAVKPAAKKTVAAKSVKAAAFKSAMKSWKLYSAG